MDEALRRERDQFLRDHAIEINQLVTGRPIVICRRVRSGDGPVEIMVIDTFQGLGDGTIYYGRSHEQCTPILLGDDTFVSDGLAYREVWLRNH